MNTSTALRPVEGLDLSGVHADLTHVLGNTLYTIQRPYRNGVVVYARSVWGGNGFGTDVTKIAVRDGEIVGIYESGNAHFAARVVGIAGSLYADRERTARGETYVTKTALNKWIAAVKAL
jgi:hypothetical protein